MQINTDHDKIHPGQLGFDFDGVIGDIGEIFLRLACEEYGFCDLRLEDITSFEVDKCLNMEAAIVEDIFTRVLDDTVGVGMKPMSGALEVLSELAEQSTVTVITARPHSDSVHDWLEAMLPQASLPAIKVVAMGDHDDKSRYILEHGLRYFIDDRAETCLQLSKTGIQPFVFHQPWNRDRHQLPMVHSWADIRGLCLL